MNPIIGIRFDLENRGTRKICHSGESADSSWWDWATVEQVSWRLLLIWTFNFNEKNFVDQLVSTRPNPKRKILLKSFFLKKFLHNSNVNFANSALISNESFANNTKFVQRLYKVSNLRKTFYFRSSLLTIVQKPSKELVIYRQWSAERTMSEANSSQIEKKVFVPVRMFGHASHRTS